MIRAFLLLLVASAILVFGLIVYALIRIKYSLLSDPFGHFDYMPAHWDFTKRKLEEDRK